MTAFFSILGLKMAFYVALMAMLALYAKRQARLKDAALAEFADCSRRLLGAEADKLRLNSIITDYKVLSQRAQAKAIAAQAEALTIRAKYEAQANAAKVEGDPDDYLRAQAVK